MVDGGKKLEALKISMEKGKAKVEVNGEDISSCGSYLNLTFENGEWSLMSTRDSFYCSSDRKPLIIGKTNDKARYCPKCFSELPEDANYCPKCGKCMREQFKYEQGYIGEKSKTVTVGFSDKAIKL